MVGLVAELFKVVVFIDSSSSEVCGFDSHYRSGSFHRDLIFRL